MKNLESFPIPDAQFNFIPKSLIYGSWETLVIAESSK